jgi:hypothetical protein
VIPFEMYVRIAVSRPIRFEVHKAALCDNSRVAAWPNRVTKVKVCDSEDNEAPHRARKLRVDEAKQEEGSSSKKPKPQTHIVQVMEVFHL